MPSPTSKPKNYFLNESHELSVEAKGGGGRHVEYPGINWTQKANRLCTSLERVSERASHSRDPLGKRKYYLIADPSAKIVKASKAKDAVGGQKLEAVVFSGEQSKFFERIGLDLIEVHPTGVATVHATPERMEQLISKTGQLAQLGAREQARFVAFESFEWLAGKWKFDQEWLDEIGKKSAEGYIKLQPLISELEADLVIRALEQTFRGQAGVALRGKGRSYLGRFFLRATLNAQMVKKLADEFTSIQSIHPPILAFTENLPPEVSTSSNPLRTFSNKPALTLPCVGVVDTAVPQEHNWLRSFRRGGAVTGLNCSNTENDNHGSMVASRVVFGDVDLGGLSSPPPATCRFLEVRVGTGQSGKILAESVSGALAAAITAAPDDQATSPQLQLCVAWDAPVCAAAESEWSCRDVKITIRPGPEADAADGSRGRIRGYPLFKRTWKLDKALAKARKKEVADTDLWIIEFSYSQIAAYAAGHTVPLSQRIAFAAEIWDEAETPLEPHSFVQSLPIASTLIRLSNTSVWLPQAISITSDV